MPWPDTDYIHPTIPTEWEDLPGTILWTLGTSFAYYGFYQWEILRIMARMPNHVYVNPSRANLYRQAASRTSYPTVARGVSILSSMVPLAAWLPALAIASAAGWVATAEHHGAVTPGVASGIGMPMTPDLYSTGTADNPAGWDFGTWWSNIV